MNKPLLRALIILSIFSGDLWGENKRRKAVMVTLTGEVVSPGQIKLKKGATLWDGILAAGGFTNTGSRYVTILKYKPATSGKTAPEKTEYKLLVDSKSESLSFALKSDPQEKRLMPNLEGGEIIFVNKDLWKPRPWQRWSRAQAAKWRENNEEAREK